MKCYHPFRTSIVVCLLASLFLRYGLIDFESDDYKFHLSVWFDLIVNNGYFYSLKQQVI